MIWDCIYLIIYRAAILAVDHIMQGRYSTTTTTATSTVKKAEKASSSCDRAFVIGRPPGHHAGPNGWVLSFFIYLFLVFI